MPTGTPLLSDVRVTFTTPDGERCTALFGDIERAAVADALELLREGSEIAERKTFAAQVERDFRAYQSAASARADARRARRERRAEERLAGIRAAAARLGRTV